MNKVYKWKMTDKPHEIAKKYNFNKFEEIWKYNKKLQSSRKKPENIKKGDSLIIPPTQAEWKKLAEKRAGLSAAMTLELSFANKLEADSKLFEEAVVVLGRYLKLADKDFLKIESEIDGNLKAAQKWGAGVDFAKELITMGRGLAKLSSLAKKSTTSTGKKLKKVNQDMMKEAAGIANAPLKHMEAAAKKALSDHLRKTGSDEIKATLGVVESLDKSFENMQKPSFWAVTAASLLDGKSWSESVTRDLVDEKNQQKARVANIRLKNHSKMEKLIIKQIYEAKRWKENLALLLTNYFVLEKEIEKIPVP